MIHILHAHAIADYHHPLQAAALCDDFSSFLNIKYLFHSLHLFIAVLLSSHHILWERNSYLLKVWISIICLNIMNQCISRFLWSPPMVVFLSWLYIYADALGSLRQSSQFVSPNDGFMEQVLLEILLIHFKTTRTFVQTFNALESYPSLLITNLYPFQLKLFEEMGFKVDYASPIYKRFRLKILGMLWFFHRPVLYCHNLVHLFEWVLLLYNSFSSFLKILFFNIMVFF